MIYLLSGIIAVLLVITGTVAYHLHQARQEAKADLETLGLAMRIMHEAIDAAEELSDEVVGLRQNIRGYEADMDGMVRMLDTHRRHNSVLRSTVENMTASIEALSTEIDDRNIAFAKLMLGGTTIEEGPLKGVRLVVAGTDELVSSLYHEDEWDDDCTCVTEPDQPCRDKSCTCVYHEQAKQPKVGPNPFIHAVGEPVDEPIPFYLNENQD